MDVGHERARLDGEVTELEANHARLSARLKDEKFLARAPEEIIEGVRDQLESVEERRARVAEVLIRLAPWAPTSRRQRRSGPIVTRCSPIRCYLYPEIFTAAW